jgi:hypothetical protein
VPVQVGVDHQSCLNHEVVEPPDMLGDHDHVGAVDVTPQPYRPPTPPAPAPPQMPKVRSNAGVPPEVLARELKRLNSFLDGDWGDPKDHPLRYPPR